MVLPKIRAELDQKSRAKNPRNECREYAMWWRDKSQKVPKHVLA